MQEKINIDKLTPSTYEILMKNGSLGDWLDTHKKFENDPSVDKEILNNLLNKIKKAYSKKFMGHIAQQKTLIQDEDLK